METPLYTKLKNLADQKPLRLHIPGHKGKAEPLSYSMVEIDFTEIAPTGNLYEVGEPFTSAQALWATEFGFEHCQFLTGGSTQGIYTALALCGKPGDKVLLDRGAHRAAVHAMGLLRQRPVYLRRPWLKELEVTAALDPQYIETMLDTHGDIKTVFITSPTYCGVLSDVHHIAQIVHDRGGKLIVDGAHGAHLPWLMIDNYSSADVVCVSAHKTLPAMGQASMLFQRGFSPELVASTASLFGTSSPSYAVLSSIDKARQWMNGEGMMEYVRVARQVATLREIFPSLTEPLFLDPLRLCLLCNQGEQVARELEKQGIYLEMANPGHLVAVFTGVDTDAEIHRFAKVLLPHFKHRTALPDLSPPDEMPKKRLDIQDVMFADKESVSLPEACGRIAGETIAPYPPGVPVVVMGEEISMVELAYLARIGYTKKSCLVIKEHCAEKE